MPSYRDSRPRRRLARRCFRAFTGLVVLAALVLAGAGYYYTSPATVRQLVVDQFRHHFPEAEISLGSARFRLLGGITFSNFSLSRRDDPSQTPVLQVPAGVIYHDKEALARGQLAIRKLELDRPKFLLARSDAGKWNVAGLLGPVRPDKAVPIVTATGGSLTLQVAGGRWEVRGVSAQLLNDPRPVLELRGRGDVADYGPVTLASHWRRDSGQVVTDVDLAAIPLGAGQLRDLARTAPELADHVRAWAGTGRVHLTAAFAPHPAQPWHHDARISVTGGRAELRDLPWPLDRIDISARCVDGRLAVERATASAGNTTATARLNATGKDLTDAEFTVDRLKLTPDLFERLPPGLRKFHQRFAPDGEVAISGTFAKLNGVPAVSVEYRPLGLTACYLKFPYPLRDVRGRIRCDHGGGKPDAYDIDISGFVNGNQRVAVRGGVSGCNDRYDIDLSLAGRGVPMDETLLKSLPAKFQPLARSFQPRGLCDFTATIKHTPGGPDDDRYGVVFRDAAIRYAGFPLPLDKMHGKLDIQVTGDQARYQVSELRGEHGPGRVVIAGHNVPDPRGDRVLLTLAGTNLPLAEPLADALASIGLRPTWQMFRPRGAIDFAARVNLLRKPDAPQELAVTVETRGATVRPTFFPYDLDGVHGRFHYEGQRVLLGPFVARHGPTTMRMGAGEVRLLGGGYWADVRDLTAGPLVPDADFIQALPPEIQSVGKTLTPTGAASVLVRRLVIHDPPSVPGPPAPPTIYWDGEADLSELALAAGVTWEAITGKVACRGSWRGQRLEWLSGGALLEQASVLKQPLHKLHAHLIVDPNRPGLLQVRDLGADAFGGRVGGEGRVLFGPEPEYALDLKVLGLDLAAFGEHNRFGRGQLDGPMTGQVYLTGRGGRPDEIEGYGSIDVPNGRLYNLPLFLELLKTVSLRAPDGVAFDEAHARFRLQGRRVRVEKLDLLGHAISMGGQGELNLDGTAVDLDFYAVWARIAQVLPAGWREVPPFLSQQFLKITMRGSLAEPKFAAEPVPFIVEPLKQLAERVRSRADAARVRLSGGELP